MEQATFSTLTPGLKTGSTSRAPSVLASSPVLLHRRQHIRRHTSPQERSQHRSGSLLGGGKPALLPKEREHVRLSPITSGARRARRTEARPAEHAGSGGDIEHWFPQRALRSGGGPRPIVAQEGELDEASQYYRQALRAAPESVVARVELGELYIQRGDLSAAQIQLELAKRSAPEDSTVRELLGDVYYGRGRTALAIREWQKALELDPRADILDKLKKALQENDQDINSTSCAAPTFCSATTEPSTSSSGGKSPSLSNPSTKSLPRSSDSPRRHP